MSDISDEAYDKTMATNVKSNHWLCQMVAPDMISKEGFNYDYLKRWGV